ncbi:MAG: hypothetical protein JW708_01880, partial [Vallitaleaceae bacterium]|nr:hypothetical protein [Vallitaleaceae bacterium]
MKSEVALLLLLFLPGVYQDLKYRNISKEYCLVLAIGSFLYSLGRQIMKNVDGMFFVEHLVYIVSLLFIQKYGYLLRGSIGQVDLVAVLVFSLFLE